MLVRDVICSFMDGEHLKPDAYMSPSFPEIKLHNGNHKKREREKNLKNARCLLDFLSAPFPLEETTADFYNPSAELQFLSSFI